MNALPASYRSGGFDWRILERQGDIALAAQTGHGVTDRLSVFIVGRAGEREIGGKIIPAGEYMPGPNAWGSQGWTPGTDARAREIFAAKVAEGRA